MGGRDLEEEFQLIYDKRDKNIIKDSTNAFETLPHSILSFRAVLRPESI